VDADAPGHSLPGDGRQVKEVNWCLHPGVKIILPQNISLILPAYNEAKSIARTLDEAVSYFESRRYTYEIIVSADGEDGTREIVAEMGRSNHALRAIGSPGRHGKGHGIREAVRIANGDIIGFADADNKVPIEEYDKFAPVLAAGSSVVIGSRALERSLIERAQPWYRQIGAKGFRVFMRSVTGLRTISDTQCGFKFFQHGVAKQLFQLQKIDGYMYDVEILLLAQRLDLQVQEIPIRWRDDGDTRLELVRGNLRNVRDILRIRLETKMAVRGIAPEKQAGVVVGARQ
jgi:dolichyl-phosphate beta-glucosyltransferase